MGWRQLSLQRGPLVLGLSPLISHTSGSGGAYLRLSRSRKKKKKHPVLKAALGKAASPLGGTEGSLYPSELRETSGSSWPGPLASACSQWPQGWRPGEPKNRQPVP